MVTDNPVVKEPSYFDLFECGKNILSRIDTMCEQACMENSRDKYYTEMYKTLNYYNDCNNAPLSNEKIREAIHEVMEMERVHPRTVDHC